MILVSYNKSEGKLKTDLAEAAVYILYTSLKTARI